MDSPPDTTISGATPDRPPRGITPAMRNRRDILVGLALFGAVIVIVGLGLLFGRETSPTYLCVRSWSSPTPSTPPVSGSSSSPTLSSPAKGSSAVASGLPTPPTASLPPDSMVCSDQPALGGGALVILLIGGFFALPLATILIPPKTKVGAAGASIEAPPEDYLEEAEKTEAAAAVAVEIVVSSLSES